MRPGLDELVTAFIGVQVPETTALLTVLGELIVDDDVLRARCRHEVDVRKDGLPRWLVGLAQTTVHRGVRMSHVLGDGDELLLGVRLADGQEMTCAVHIDHLMMSAVKDAFFVPESVDAVVSVAKASNTDPDTSFVEVGLAEARAELQLCTRTALLVRARGVGHLAGLPCTGAVADSTDTHRSLDHRCAAV